MTTLSPIVHLMANATTKMLTPSQKRFQKLIQDIDLKRRLLTEWEAAIAKHHKDYQAKFVPLQKTFNENRVAFLLLLDQAYSEKAMTKTLKKKLQILICEIADTHLHSEDNETVKEIYNRYSGSDYDAEQREEAAAIAAMIADRMGVSLDEEEADSPEDLFQQLREKVAQMEKEAIQRENAKETRKKSAKLLEKEAKEKEAELQVSQSIRDVYRQLAKALHPDQEQDVAARDRKTLLMQRANDAYQKKSLLTLLELQLEVEQIDQSELENLSEERLSHYNKILKTQYTELCQELLEMEFSFKRSFGIDDSRRLSPKLVTSNLKKEIQAMNQRIEALQHDLWTIKTVEDIKTWVKYA